MRRMFPMAYFTGDAVHTASEDGAFSDGRRTSAHQGICLITRFTAA